MNKVLHEEFVLNFDHHQIPEKECKDKVKINTVRLSLLYAVMPDYEASLNNVSSFVETELADSITRNGNSVTFEFKHEIDVTNATGRSSDKSKKHPKNSQERFQIRVKAFRILSDYYNKIAITPLLENKESLQYLTRIFEYQEDKVFGCAIEKPSNRSEFSYDVTCFNKNKNFSKPEPKNTSDSSSKLLPARANSDYLVPTSSSSSKRKQSSNSSKNVSNDSLLLNPNSAQKRTAKKTDKKRRHKNLSVSYKA